MLQDAGKQNHLPGVAVAVSMLSAVLSRAQAVTEGIQLCGCLYAVCGGIVRWQTATAGKQ